tara:strand:- start:1342 stop:1590 length:249 start_codon:yes stop_codon:yes gene_type:complete
MVNQSNDKKSIKTKKEIFISKYDNYSVENLLKELIYRDQMRKFEIERIRSNSAALVNWLVACPFILGIIYIVLKILFKIPWH